MRLPDWFIQGWQPRRGSVVPYQKEEKAANVWTGFQSAEAYTEYQKILSAADDLSLAHTRILSELRAATFSLQDDEREFNAATMRREMAERMAERAARGMSLAEGYDTLEGLAMS